MKKSRFIYAAVLVVAMVLSFVFGVLLLPPMVSGRWKNNRGPSVPTPPADLNGQWRQVNTEESSYYHLASIHDGVVEVYWYTPSDDSLDLYWYGTYTPPQDGKTPYTWESESLLETLGNWKSLRFALRDESKEFTYSEKGELSYTIYYGHIKMSSSLERTMDSPLAGRELGGLTQSERPEPDSPPETPGETEPAPDETL